MTLGRNTPSVVTLKAGLLLQVALQYPDWDEVVAATLDTGKLKPEQLEIITPAPGFVILGPDVV